MPTDRDRLVEENLQLVRSLAGQLVRSLPAEVPFEDLVGAGTRGLVEAADRYDPARGAAFATFAYYRIRGAILDEVRRMTWLPKRIAGKMRCLEKGDEVAEAALPPGPPPRGEDAARLLAETLSEMAVAFVATVEAFEETPADSDPDRDVETGEERGRLRDAVDVLPEKEKALLRLHYFEDVSLQEAGRRLGLSKSWASRLHSRALRLLREQLSAASGR